MIQKINNPDIENQLQEQINKLIRANEQLTLLNNVTQAITSTLNLKDVLNSITHQIKETMEVEACTLLILDEQSGELVFEAASGMGAEQLIGFRLEPQQGIAGWVIHEGRPALLNDVQGDSRFFPGIDKLLNMQTRSVACVPLRIKDKAIGVIEAVNKFNGQFDQETLQLLDSLASTAAMAIENARLYSDLQVERDQLVHKEEEFRRVIARDLHDGPTQLVSAVAMHIEYIKTLTKVAPEQVDQALDHLQNMAFEAAHDIRNLLFGLHPTILETQGLEAALQIYVDRFHDRAGMKLRLAVEPELKLALSKETEIGAFIIIQEAVNNAKKHAEASQATITLRQGDNVLEITIQDDGQGFDIDQVINNYDERVSFGLTTMAERARLINGRYRVHSEPGQGTTVTLTLPVEQPRDLIAKRLRGI